MCVHKSRVRASCGQQICPPDKEWMSCAVVVLPAKSMQPVFFQAVLHADYHAMIKFEISRQFYIALLMSMLSTSVWAPFSSSVSVGDSHFCSCVRPLAAFGLPRQPQQPGASLKHEQPCFAQPARVRTRLFTDIHPIAFCKSQNQPQTATMSMELSHKLSRLTASLDERIKHLTSLVVLRQGAFQ